MKQAVAALALVLALSVQARAETVRIMAAFTFKSALDEVVQAYKSNGGGDVQPIYGPTPALAKQVENLIPADIFLSADSNWMNYLQQRGLIQSESRVNLLSADLVLVTRSDNTDAPTDVSIGRDYPLAKIVSDGRVAMCDPADHPAGRFGRAGLEGLGFWSYVEPKVAIAENPPAAVALVARGEVPVAVVFSTDVKHVKGVKVAGVFPESSHPPIEFPAAILRGNHDAETAQFFSFLKSKKAAAVFAQHGYRPL